jgi:Family of unknown function (DUF6356)
MNPFIKHPNEMGMNYFQHFLFAFTVQFKLLLALLACFVHAFFPFLFTTTASTIIRKLDQGITGRKPKQARTPK